MKKIGLVIGVLAILALLSGNLLGALFSSIVSRQLLSGISGLPCKMQGQRSILFTERISRSIG
jgi:hypothetical protein